MLDYGRVSSSWRWFSRLCGGMYRGLSEVAGVMGGGLWCPLTSTPPAFHRTHREESRGEQGDVRIVPRPGPMVRSSGQGIGLPHASPRSVVQDEVKASKE